MSLTPQERRTLAEIGELLAGDRDLVALAALFAQPPHTPAGSAADPRRSLDRVVVGLFAVAASVGVACALTAVHSVVATAAATVLVLAAGLILFLALTRYAR